MNFYNRVKKYLFLLASLISIVLVIHIVVVYMYDGAEEVSEKGGSFSIGFVDTLPNLDPTLSGMNTRKDFVLSFLYRGLLRYNPESRAIEGDIATCDLSKNLSEIRCNLKEDGVWSDGSKITIEDILATYSLLVETDKNKGLQNGLSKFAITREGTSVVFRNSSSNTENIEYLTIPIIKKSVAEQMRAGEKIIDPVYSGEYVFDKKDSNPSHGSESIHLIKSNLTSRAIYDRLILRFYSDEESLLGDLGSVNLIYPNSLTEQPKNSRFSFNSYSTPDYTSAFINSNKFGLESRKVISKIIANAFEESSKNPFGVDSPSISNTGVIQDEVLEKMGFFRKNKLIPKQELPEVPKTSSGSTGGITDSSATGSTNITPSPTPKIQSNPKLRFFDSPGNTEKVAAVFMEEIQIGGSVPKNIDTVSINGYELKGYQAGSARFLYRARTSIGNLILGKNIYEVKMYSKGKLQFSEKLELYTTRSSIDKKNLEISWEEKPKVPPSNTNSGAITEINSGSLQQNTGSSGSIQGVTSTLGGQLMATGAQSPISPITSSGTIVSGVAKPGVLPEKNDTKLYTASGSQAKINIHFIPSTKTITEDVDKLKSVFERTGFQMELISVSPDTESILEARKATSKTYDIFVVSVNLGFIGTNLTPYFHSGQVQDGFNFSGIKNPSLDPLLEEISTKELPFDQKTKVLKKISDILRQENISVPLRLNSTKVATDMLVKDFQLPEILPESKYIKDSLLKSYMKTVFIVEFEKKNFSNFLNWSRVKLFQS